MADGFYVGEKVKVKDHKNPEYVGKIGKIARKGAMTTPGKLMWVVSLESPKEDVHCFEEQLELVLPW
ncbi:hypothetical protein ACFLU7_00415 [Chloroflexota bacterium]